MKFRKLVMCGIFAATAVMMSVPTAVSVRAAETVSGEADAYESESTGADSQSAEENLQETTTENENAMETTEVSGSLEASEETSEWTNRLLVVVEEDSSLNIRSEATTESEVVGRLKRGAAADIVEKGDEWTKIVSGDVEGYVKNDYCLFESDAEAQAEEICGVTATASTDGLRIRSEASTDSVILDVLDAGESISVVTTESEAETQAAENAEETQTEVDSEENAQTEDAVAEPAESAETEWVQVEYNGKIAYVSAEYVDVALDIGEAQNIEDVAAAQSSATTQGSAVSASTDDVTLLAAIIQCEAGGECYEGQLAVGAVVMNRVKSGSYPNSISGVIYQSGQFSPASSGKLSRVISGGNISSSCYQAANAAISGQDNTGGALHFHAGSGNGRVIGNQVFY